MSQIWLSMNNAIINAACIIAQYGSMQKIGFSFILFLIFLFYVIKGKAALELEGVLVSELWVCAHAMHRLNRNRVKTNQIGQYTLKINSIILKLQKLSLFGEQNAASGNIPIINLSASRQNRSSENRDASKNRLFFPPLVCRRPLS